MRIAFHAINGVGLGHVVRATSIATEVRTLHSEAQILVLTNAADTSVVTRAGFDLVSFPPRLAEPHADPERVRRALPAPLEYAAMTAALRAFRPDLVVFDTHAPTALAHFAASIGARTVLVQRELRRDALANFLASDASAAFDRIVVPHEAGEVDLRCQQHLPVIVTGTVVRALDTKLPRRVKAPHVVVMAGGGGQPVDARRFLRAAADAHILAHARIPGLSTVLVTGPYGEVPDHLDAVPGLDVTRSCDHLAALLARASVIVSQAGYNSVAEIRALGKPAILVPAHRHAEDQMARARRLADMGAAVLARPDARSIADRLEALLLTPGTLASMTEAHRKRPLVPGNRTTADAVLRPLRAGREVRRVVLVAHEFAPRFGGMETVARTLALGLLDQGIDVRVYATRHFGPETSGLPQGTVRRLFSSGMNLWSDLLATLDALLVDAPDVVHLCNAGLAPWVPALRAAFPAAVSINVHGNDLLAPWARHDGQEAAYRASLVGGLRAADVVIAVSSFSARLARLAGARRAAIQVVENGVDSVRFRPGPAEVLLASRMGIAPDDEVVLTVSRLVPRKGHATALRAMAEVLRHRPRALYVYTGESARLSPELEALARELGIVDRVRAIGMVDDGDLPAIYRMARVFLLLSEESATDVEGFGVALLEAAASGLPVVATRTGGIPEAVADGSTAVLVPPADASATARALASLLADPCRMREMGNRGRARAAQRFSTTTRTAQIVERWTSILRRGVALRPLRAFRAALAGDPGPAASARALAQRAALREATTGVALLRLAQEDAMLRRVAAAKRRATFAKIVNKGGVVRLRAMEDGVSLLAGALSDCQALGHRPLVEMKLRRFVGAEFQDYALPFIRGARVVQVVPMQDGEALLQRLAVLPDASFAKITSVRIFLSREAQASWPMAMAAVPEAHALERLFAAHGVRVIPPPDLARYLSDAPAEGPRAAMIEPTNLCNLGCPTCPTGKGKIKPKPQMSVERFDSVVRALTPRLQTLALWNYGEPLLHRDLPAIIGKAKAAGVRVVKVSSNAHFLDGEKGRRLLSSGLDVLILCVDGASQATYEVFRKGGDFARVAEQVAWICAEKKRRNLTHPIIDLQFIVMRHNEHELDEIRRLAGVWGTDHLRIKTVGAEDDATRHLVPTTKLLSRYREDGTHNAHHPFCTMPWDHTVVNVDGSVTPCCYLRPDMGDAFVMGNVFETPFDEIWGGERYRAFRAAMLAGRSAMPVCMNCRGGTHDLFAAIEEVAAQ